MSASRGSKTGLVADLMQKPDCADREVLIAEAMAGDYHDFHSGKHDLPKVALVNRLNRFGYRDLAKRAMRGDYDDDPDDQDKEALAASVEKGGNPLLAGAIRASKKGETSGQ